MTEESVIITTILIICIAFGFILFTYDCFAMVIVKVVFGAKGVGFVVLLQTNRMTVYVSGVAMPRKATGTSLVAPAPMSAAVMPMAATLPVASLIWAIRYTLRLVPTLLASLTCIKKAVLLETLVITWPVESKRVGEEGVKVPVPMGTAKVNVMIAETP